MGKVTDADVAVGSRLARAIDAPKCRACGGPVIKERAMYDVFEQMHWVCFHYEFEHTSTDDRDEPCGDPSCPMRGLGPWRDCTASESRAD